jgi:iron complex transport system substrate-binding protein
MKKLLITVLIACTLCSLAACGGGQSNIARDLPAEEMQTVTDCIGREVSLVQNVDRIAALFSPAGHITAMLGHGKEIVATSNGLQRDKLLHEICPEIKNASVVKVNGDFNIEELIALQVDVVLLSYDMYLDKTAMDKLDKFNIPYVVVYFNSMEEQKQLVRVIADVLNEEEEAQSYLDFYDKAVSLVSEALSGLEEQAKITVYHSINEVVATVGKGTLSEDWMKVAGGIDVSLEGNLKHEDDKYYTTLEQILAWDPEVILCNEESTAEYIRQQDAWRNLQAVKHGKVYLMPVGVSRWGHTTSTETPLAIVWTAKTLYPELCENIDIKALMREFYLNCFEYDISDEQIAQILNGEGMRLSKERD